MKQIPNFPNHYITEQGDVISRGRVHKQCTTKSGYKQVKLYYAGFKKHFYIHRLVAEAFIPNPDSLPYVNHIDFDKTNNNVSNLEWCSASYNIKYSYDAGRCEKSRQLTSALGKKYGGRFKRKVQSIENGIIYPSIKQACKEVGLKTTSNIINAIKSGYRSGGYHWRYI